MKKMIAITLILLVGLMLFTGCSTSEEQNEENNEENENSEEEGNNDITGEVTLQPPAFPEV